MSAILSSSLLYLLLPHVGQLLGDQRWRENANAQQFQWIEAEFDCAVCGEVIFLAHSATHHLLMHSLITLHRIVVSHTPGALA